MPLVSNKIKSMASIIPWGSQYVCRGCRGRLSRQYSTITRRYPRVISGFAAFDGVTYLLGNGSQLGNRKNWEFSVCRKTPSLQSTLHTNEHGKEAEKVTTEMRPRGRIRLGRPRRMEQVVIKITEPREAFPPAESNMPRPLRRSRAGDVSEDLMPSTPSTPLGSKAKPTPKPISSSVPPTSTGKKHLGSPEDFNWYWESFPPTLNDKVVANRFFSNHGKNAKLLRSVAQFRIFPESDVPEVAFVGRSNVGKSSLLNAVVGADIKSLLARTSATPGFTKTMNLYGVGSGNGIVIKKQPDGRDKIVGWAGLTIVDMPGYGEGSLSSWGIEIMKYIQSRKQLRRVFVLLDAQHGIKDKDRSLLASLRLAGVSHQVILSKMDKLYIPKAKEVKHFNGKTTDRLKSKGTVAGLREAMEKLKTEIQPPFGGAALGEIIACSAETVVDGKRLGIDHVRYAVLKAAGLEAGVKRQSKDV